MARAFQSPALAVFCLSLVLSLGLGGCASGGMLEQLPPAVGGEPAGLPAKPKADYRYPAVHDMPPDRASAPLSDTDQVRLEKELQAARDKQEAQYGAASQAEPPAKKKPAAAKTDQTSGAKTNP